MSSNPNDMPALPLLLGAHCARRLWLQCYEPGRAELRLGPPHAGLAALARGLFPPGIAVPDEGEDAVAATARLLAGGAEVLYDAAFRYQGLHTTVELLWRRRDRWYAYQTRCRASLKPVHLQEAALQNYILRGAGLTLSGSYLLHLNKTYVRRGPLELAQLFVTVPVTRAVRGMQPAIAQQLARARLLLEADAAPLVEPGSHCQKPSPCGFAAHCAVVPAPTPEAGPPVVDRAALDAFLKRLRYPLSFLDFEAYQPPVPEFDGHWPFRQVPFQFSLHRQAAPDAPLEHEAFLAEGTGDPGPAFLAQLLAGIGTEGSVLVYGSSTELTVLRELAADHPGQASALDALRDRIVDLSVPFLKKQVLLPALGGRSSLKAVLPQLVPGASYYGMAIADGGAAHLAFAHLRRDNDPGRIAQTRADLLAYCALDTFALVQVLDALRRL